MAIIKRYIFILFAKILLQACIAFSSNKYGLEDHLKLSMILRYCAVKLQKQKFFYRQWLPARSVLMAVVSCQYCEKKRAGD
jgi:hypothetical protein